MFLRNLLLLKCLPACQFQRVILFSTDANPCLAEYLVGSLGFSQQQSLATSAKLSKMCQAAGKKNFTDFNFAENADSVVKLLKQHGFNETHLRKLVCFDPRVLTSKVDKTLKPKLGILQELGLTGSHLANAIVKNPVLLRQRLGPAMEALRDVMGTDDNVACVLKRLKWVYLSSLIKNFSSNVALLENEYAFLKDNIRKHIIRNPNPYVLRSESFQDLLTRVENKLGIPRHSSMFLHGLNAATLSDKNIESKCQVFKSFGWTDCAVTKIIKSQPLVLNLSEANLKRTLEVLMNELGYKPDYLASHPVMLTYSIVKRILPRHRILTALKEKGLLSKDYSLYRALQYNELKFLQKFVLPFEEVHGIFAKETGCCEKWLKEQVKNQS